MAIGERIRFHRNLSGMTQKQLGVISGLSEKTADIRMAQYEHGSRHPKEELIAKIAYALGISTEALTVPNIDEMSGIMHILFTLEDLHGFMIDMIDDEPVIRLNKLRGDNEMKEKLLSWYKEAEKYSCGQISKEKYNAWRYNFPPEKC